MKKTFLIFLFAALIACPAIAQDYNYTAEHDKQSPIYQPGEQMVFTVKILRDGQSASGIKLKWKRTGDDGKTDSGEGITTADGYQIKTSLASPGFVRVQVRPFDEDGKQLTWHSRGRTKAMTIEMGACVEPEKLRGIDEPEDFDSFWQSRHELLDEVPVKLLEMIEVEGNDKIRAFDIKIACPGKMPVSGYLLIPRGAKAKSLAATVMYQGYGIRSSIKHLWLGEKEICLDINAHGIKNGQPASYYAQLGQTTLKRYALNKEENMNRETMYFHDMILRALRAAEFVKTLPQWNGHDLTVNGYSQGGMQSLIVAGQDQDVTHCHAGAPWCCDMGRVALGRVAPDWGIEYTPAMEYYDPANHIKRANPDSTLFALVNLGDYTCTPSGIWVAYNNFRGAKKMEMRQANQHMERPKTFSKFIVETPAAP